MDAQPATAPLTRARALLARHPLIDGHNDLPWKIRTSKSAPSDLDGYDLTTTAPDGGHKGPCADHHWRIGVDARRPVT